MTADYPQRVAFEDGRFLQASDLLEEQRYHIQRRWQHNLALHSWGILCGLDVEVVGDAAGSDCTVTVHGGMALDGFGRELIVTDDLKKRVVLDPAVSYDAWLEYNITADDGRDAEGACLEAEYGSPGRLLEQPTLRIDRVTNRQSDDVVHPDRVRPGDDPYAPQRPMRFGREDAWPVFLGRLETTVNGWTVNPSERHYGGLIAQRIECPKRPSDAAESDDRPEGRRTVLLNGGDPRYPDWRFAVLDGADSHDPRAPIVVRESPTPADGQVGSTELLFQAERVVADADVILRRGAALQFDLSDVSRLPPTLPTRGWGIYRTFHPPTPSESAFADVLRIAMPDGRNDQHQIAIGATDEAGNFTPILVVKSDESVDVYGPLRVHGLIFGTRSDVPSGIRPDTNLDLVVQLMDPSVGTDELGRIKILQSIVARAAPAELAQCLVPTELGGRGAEILAELARRIGATARDQRGPSPLGRATTELVESIVENMDAEPLAAAIGNAAIERQASLYVALAKHLVIAVGEPAEGERFAAQAARAPAAPLEEFLKALLPLTLETVKAGHLAEAINERGDRLQFFDFLVNSLDDELVRGPLMAALTHASPAGAVGAVLRSPALLEELVDRQAASFVSRLTHAQKATLLVALNQP